MFGPNPGFGLLSFIFNSEASDMEDEMRELLDNAKSARESAEQEYAQNRDFAESQLTQLDEVRSNAWHGVISLFLAESKNIKNVNAKEYAKTVFEETGLIEWKSMESFQKTRTTFDEWRRVEIFSKTFQIESAHSFFSMLKAEENLEKAREHAAKANYETEKIKTRADLLFRLGNLAKTYASFIEVYMPSCIEATQKLIEILREARHEQEKFFSNRAKKLFNVSWEIDFNKLDERDQRSIQIIYIMNEMLYRVIMQPLLSEGGNIVEEAEKKIELASNDVKKLPMI